MVSPWILEGGLDELDVVRLVLNTDHLLGRLVVDEATLVVTGNGANRSTEAGVPSLDGEDSGGDLGHFIPFVLLVVPS
jgi:hypothetical protein